MMKIYTLKTCDSCRKATQWLTARQIAYHEIPIREQTPNLAELKLALIHHQGELRKLFNVSGADYREKKIKDILSTMTEADALDLLTSNGNLIKRPFLVTPHTATAGFYPDVWALLFD